MTSALNLDVAPTGDTTGTSTWLRDECQTLAAQGYTTIAIGERLGIGQQRVSEILGRAQRGNLANRGVVSVMLDEREVTGSPFKFACSECGMRSAGPTHPLGASGRPRCVERLKG